MIKTPDKRLALNLFLAMALAASALVAVTFLARPALAADITVNTTEDETNFDGDCSLREAIIAANTDAVAGACSAGSGPDTITVPAGTYTLSIPGANEDAALTGDLDVTGTTDINGAGARETIVQGDAGFDDRIFDNTGTTTISGLTITGGNTSVGGGLRNGSGTLSLHQVAVTGNTGRDRSGGVDVSGGTVNLTGSTVYTNQTEGDGGAMYLVSGTTNITNSTLSGNRALSGNGGGIVVSSAAAASIKSSTIASNSSDNLNSGGGIHATGSSAVDVKNTIISDNTADNCATFFSATITSLGNNMSSDDSCGFTQATDQEDIDPLLGPLQDNGGPTDTHALLAGSSAIDSGDSDEAEDQRGEARPADGDGDGTATDDIGAFEQAADTAPEITPLSPKPGSRLSDRTPRIRAEVTDLETDLAEDDITLFVDGKKKDAFTYSTTNDLLSYKSGKLKEGRRHTVKIEATDGQNTSSRSWSFKVKNG